jgi:hypothetical protein
MKIILVIFFRVMVKNPFNLVILPLKSVGDFPLNLLINKYFLNSIFGDESLKVGYKLNKFGDE